MHKVMQHGEDVTAEHNPNSDRYLYLKGDMSFESGGTPFGRNTGKYRFDESSSTLFLDSDVGEEDDSQWLVTIQNDTMYWSGLGSEWAKNFAIVHVRKN